jgi:hypothetical protein
MTRALNLDQVSNLSTELLSNLNEGIFFSKLSSFMMDHFGEYKVQVFESFGDGTTQLRAEDGKAIDNGMTFPKGQNLSGYVTRMKRAYYSNSKRDPMLATSKRDESVESELCVPVLCEDLMT